MIYDPSAKAGSRITTPVSQLDLLPTLLNLLGFEAKGGSLPGKLLWEASPERTLYAHCWYELGCMAAIKNDAKYIEHFGRKNNEFYDLQTDRAESVNLHNQLDQSEIDQWKAELFRVRIVGF